MARDALYLLDHGVSHVAFPGVEHLDEQRTSIGEEPIEAALGHPESLRQRLDSNRVWPSCGEHA
jgi:hypothetical protein